MVHLTQAQRRVFRFIEEEMAASGIPPTLRTIQKAFGFASINSVQTHVSALVAKGFLKRDDGKARGISLSDQHRAGAISIPILGTVTAGIPKEATELFSGALPVPDRLGKKGDCFALRIKGDSMIDAGIHEGDLVIVRKQSTAKNGEIVVALIDGEVTVKRLEKQKDSAWLVAANARYRPVPIPPHKDAIQGKVIGVQRYYE
jgi:repressor LexA